MLRQQIVSGVFWNFTQQLSTRSINVLVTLILAHFLIPDDFGLLAMITVFIAIATTLADSGFTQALIRQKDLSQVDYCSAFYSNLILGCLAYGLLYATAPYVASFYEEPNLTKLLRATGIIVIISSFQMVQGAVLSRALDFKTQMKVSIPATITSGVVAICMAYMGYGVWALVFQMLIAATLTAILLWAKCLWRPSLEFSYQSAKKMFLFGYKILLSALIAIVFDNIYIIVIAKIFSSTITGYYFFANKIKVLILNQIVIAIQQVTLPGLAKIQDDDERLKEAYRKIVQVTSFILFPVMLLLAALAEPLFNTLLPANWASAVPYLQLMCFAALLYPLHAINLNILQVKGRSDLFLLLEVIKKLMILIVLAISIRFGIFGMLIGQIVTSVLSYIPNSYFSSKLIDYPVRQQILDFLPSLLLAFIVSGIVYSAVQFTELPDYIELIVFGCSGIMLYFASGYLFRLNAFSLVRTTMQGRLYNGQSTS